MSSPGEAYTTITETLKDRILALIPEHPEILEFDSAWRLFGVDGFDCSDLEPSAFQAGWALNKARQEYKEKGESNGDDNQHSEPTG